MDTLGMLIDKLSIVNLKVWNEVEVTHGIHKMKDFEEFYERYGSKEGMLELYNSLSKLGNLNLQRNKLIDEIDELFVGCLEDYACMAIGRDIKELLYGYRTDLTQPKHKSATVKEE